MTPLLATGWSAGRRYVLVVGLYTLGVYLPAQARRPARLVIVHQPIRSTAEALDAVAVFRAFGLTEYERR